MDVVMMGEGSGGGVGLVLYLSFFVSIHGSEFLFVLCDLCSLCLGLCPLGFDFCVFFWVDFSVSFWVLIMCFWVDFFICFRTEIT